MPANHRPWLLQGSLALVEAAVERFAQTRG